MIKKENPVHKCGLCNLTVVMLTWVILSVSVRGQTTNQSIVAGPIVNPGNGHKYYLLEPTSWTNAEAEAVSMGGHLVTINDPQENAWVYDTFANFGGTSRELWIGLYDPTPTVGFYDVAQQWAKFSWSSGQPTPATPELWGSHGVRYPNGGYTNTGYFKLCGPASEPAWDRGHWVDESESTPLNGVVELPTDLEIVTQPKHISIGIGCDAALVAFADGTSPIGYQWQVAGTNLAGQTEPTLRLTNVQPYQTGFYWVIASNASGAITSAPALISVAGVVTWGGDLGGDPRAIVPSELTNVVAIAAGWMFDLALKADGSVVGWGFSPDPPSDLTNAIAIAAGENHCLALRADGTVTRWGTPTDVPVPANLNNVVAIDAAGDNDLALKADGTVVAWGWRSGFPTMAPSNLTNVVAISATFAHALALRADGTVVDWNDGTAEFLPTPPDLTNVVAISAGLCASLALKADGTVRGWSRPGADWAGVLNIPPGLSNVVAITAKGDHGLALIGDGSVVAWGTNIWGQTSVPQGLPHAVAIAAGNKHSMALLKDGAPTLTVQPWDRTVALGSTASLGAKAAGVQSMNYQWQFNGRDIAGATSDVYCITNAQLADLGVYTLAISNQVGAVASRQARVSISGTGLAGGIVAGPIFNPANGHKYYLLEPDTWTNAEATAVALGGHLVTINDAQENDWINNTFADFAGIGRDLWIGLYDTDPTNVIFDLAQQWAKFAWTSGQPTPLASQLWGSHGLWPCGGCHISTGYFKLVAPNSPQSWDAGRWVDEVPSTLLNGVVELPLDLEIVVQPQQISAGLGTSAKLAVFADGTSPLSYQWQFCGINLPGQTASTLIFTNTQPTQSGFYSVIVSNASGSITSAPVLLSVAGIATWGEPDARAAVPPGLTNVVAIAAGAYFDLALSADGTVAAWGENWQNPLDVPPDLTNAIAIAAGTYHGLALRADGTVVSWGSTDVPAPADLTNVVAIDAGDNNNLALKADGTVVAWNNSSFWSSVAPASLTNIVAISAAGEYDIALEADGTVVDWNDATGELLSPPAGLTNIVAISASDSGNLVLRADGTVTGWSRGWDWMRVLDIPADLTNVVAISAKGNHGLAIIADGTAVAAWGTNLWGEGNVPAGLPNVVAVAGGVGHSMALLRDGSPAMTVQPWDRAVRVGTSASLEAKVVGKLSMQYQWQLNGEDIVGATSDTYNITNVQAADAGVYTLAVSNQVGAIASREAKLIVVSGGSGNINHAPVLPTLADWSINESTQFVVTNAATDPDGAGQALTYELVNAPTGATIDANGVIRWTPDQAQGSSAVMITTVVTDNETPSLSATNRFTVIVNGPYYGIDLADWAQALTDTNRNGLCNLLEFALGLNPHNPMTDNSALTVAVSAEGGTNYLAMTYRQRIIAGPLPLQYVPEVSPDRLTWYSGNEDLQTVNTSPLNAQFESVTVRDLLPISPTAPRFMRLRVLSAAAEALSPVWIGTDTVIKGNNGAGSQLSLFSQQMVLPIQYAGKAGALNNTELTDFNGCWVDEQFGTNGLRSYVEFDNGRMLDIADSAAANRTLKLADSLGGISLPGDAYRIRAHATVASLFGNNNETGLMAGPNPSRADNVLLLLPKTQRTITLFYYSNPTFTAWQGWVRADDFAPACNEVVYPEQGVMVRRNLPGDIHLYLCGLVRTEPMVVSVQQGYNLVGAGSSTRTLTLSQLGMFTGNSTTGIAGGLNPAVGDNLVVVQPDNSITTYFYYYWPGVYQGWVNAGNFIVSDDVLIAPGSAFFLNRQAPGAFTWTIPAQ